MEKELKELIKKFMLEKGIGYVWLSASTNIERTDVKLKCDIELEENIQDQGYKC